MTKESFIEKIQENKNLYLSKIGANYDIYQTPIAHNGLWLRILIHDTYFCINTYLDTNSIASSMFYYKDFNNYDIFVGKYNIRIKNISFNFEYVKFV